MGRQTGKAREIAVDPICAHVGARIRMRRRELGMSKCALAQRLGVAEATLWKYEQGRVRLAPAVLARVAKALAVPIDWLFADLPPALERTLPRAGAGAAAAVIGIPDRREQERLARAFLAIQDPEARRGILRMVRALADSPEYGRLPLDR